MIFQSYIDMPQLLKECFVEKKFDPENKEYMRLHGKYYYFNKMGIVFVNVRIGLDKIPPEYYKGIKNLFQLKSCIGIIGGKTRLAYYFIGYNDEENSLLYLDPHITKESDKEVTIENILEKHNNKEIDIEKLRPLIGANGLPVRDSENNFVFLDENNKPVKNTGYYLLLDQNGKPVLNAKSKPIIINSEGKMPKR